MNSNKMRKDRIWETNEAAEWEVCIENESVIQEIKTKLQSIPFKTDNRQIESLEGMPLKSSKTINHIK